MPEARVTSRPALVVTGGSSGIGAALCRSAAREGWRVWIGYATGRERAERIAGALSAEGAEVAAVALPLHQPVRLLAGVARIAAGPCLPEAVALCGAPAPDVASLLKLRPEHFRRQLECAVTGNHVLIAELWRRCFRPRGGGTVLAVLSAAQGPSAASHMAAYVAAKGGLEALLHAAAAELGRAGLRVGVVRPGYVETPMLGAFEPLLLERARGASPGRRFLRPEAVADALLRGLRNPSPPGHVAELTLDAAEAA